MGGFAGSLRLDNARFARGVSTGFGREVAGIKSDDWDRPSTRAPKPDLLMGA
jgi:hypothetical protein